MPFIISCYKYNFKEYIKYKKELIAVSDYKKLMKLM